MHSDAVRSFMAFCYCNANKILTTHVKKTFTATVAVCQNVLQGSRFLSTAVSTQSNHTQKIDSASKFPDCHKGKLKLRISLLGDIQHTEVCASEKLMYGIVALGRGTVVLGKHREHGKSENSYTMQKSHKCSN